ncbi:MAG TPA: alanine--tRNA ligase [Gaiellaceae bacterium]
MRTTAELRAGFLSFFEEKGHLRQPSASLVPPPADRSTLLTSAGMQPQMPFFLGREQPPAPLTTSVQKCFRTPDIDEVGLDTYHLTFFEMLGNFSFGQYFKEGAIELASEFIRERMGLEWERIWASVHAGDPELKLGPDEEAIELWQKLGLPLERIVPLPSSENFWSVGGPGPCGPDSEIYYDRGEEQGCGRVDCQPGCSCERFLEIWNLVFMTYELRTDGTLTPLPKQNIDTGMGLERAATTLQDVISVYDTDGYRSIMDWIEAESGLRYGDSEDATKAHRVLADHGRGMTFLVGDGVTPSNEGRGYVLRRVIRRAAQHGRRIELERPFLARLAEVVIGQMGAAYPELVEHRGQIRRVLTEEEERFAETLERGLKLFDEAAARGEIGGEEAFVLQATYGFPIELTVELARERGQTVNLEEFEREMARHREISRAGAVGAPEAKPLPGRGEFVGYERTEVLTAIIALEPRGEGLFDAKLERSPFYPEGGGQVSDLGFIENEATGARAELVQAIRFGDDQVLRFQGEGFTVGERVRAVVPWSVRFPTMANHTATHLLHQALREVLGEHVRQAGSAVRPDKLRFDFTHPQALSTEERAEVERRVNEIVFENRPVRAFVTPIAEARKLGAMMLFGEKYGEEVRVVEVDGYSRELCGGTHVSSTAQVGPFVILSESSVGAGARRIEAVTAGEAFAYLREGAEEAEELRTELARARKQAERRPAAAREAKVEPKTEAEIAGVNLYVGRMSDVAMDVLLAESDRIKQERQPAAVVLGSNEDGRVHLVANFDRSLEGKVDAVAVIKAAAAEVGGGGGGRSTMARAGGSNPEKLGAALEKAEEALRAALQ